MMFIRVENNFEFRNANPHRFHSLCRRIAGRIAVRIADKRLAILLCSLNSTEPIAVEQSKSFKLARNGMGSIAMKFKAEIQTLGYARIEAF